MEFLQFTFNDNLLVYWDNNPIAKQIVDLVGYLDIVIYLNNKTSTIYISVFYVFVFIVLLAIVNIAYVSYSFARKYFTSTLPLYILSKTAKVFITILFIPVISLNLSMFVCIEKNGKFYNKVSPQLQCYVGFHYIHMITSFVMSCIFFTICLVVVVTFFECSEFEEDIEAK